MVVAVRRYDVPDRWIMQITPNDEPFGDKMRRLREAQGLSQLELAGAIARPNENVNSLQTLLSRYETGRVGTPDSDVLERLEDFYELPRDALGFAAYKETQRPKRRSIPPNSVVIGPADPELVEIIKTLNRIKPAQMHLVAEHLRLLAEGPPPKERAEDEPTA